MYIFIPQILPKLIFFLSLSLISSCNTATIKSFKQLPTKKLVTPSGEKFKTYIANGYKDQRQGLSHVLPDEFSETEAMFFTGKKMKARQFWMPNTHFNLDIIFLNQDLYILDIHRNLSHFIKNKPEHLVPRSKTVFCQYVLEVKSGGKLSKLLKPGMLLKWD